jgi:hypothetical protein
MTGCFLCRHYRRAQKGPYFWEVDCDNAQSCFPHALDCAFYQPPPLPEFGRETGLGYVWDGEYEGPA